MNPTVHLRFADDDGAKILQQFHEASAAEVVPPAERVEHAGLLGFWVDVPMVKLG